MIPVKSTKIAVLFTLMTSCLLMALPAMAMNDTDQQLAAQYVREGSYEKAVALYEEIYEKDNSPVIYNHYLESLIALEEYRDARRLVEDQIDNYPGIIRYKVDLGWVHHVAGNSRRERRQMEGLIDEIEPVPADVVDLAGAFEARGFMDRALETYKKGRDILSDEHPMHLRIASIYDKKGEYKAMMEEYVDYLNAYREEMGRVRGILQDAIAVDPDFEKNDALRQVLLTRSQDNPDNILYPEMLMWLSIQQQDFQMAFRQARVLDRRLGKEGETVLEVAELSTNNENYQVAADAYQHLLDMGEDSPRYLEALVGYLNVRFLSVTGDYEYEEGELEAIEKEYHAAIDDLGINRRTVQLVRNLANLKAFHLDKTNEAISLLENTLELSNISNRVKGECRVEMADILLLTGEVWDATLLYSQVDRMFRDDPLAHEAKFKNARLSYFIGEFDWAKAQLDVLKAGTSRLIANDAMQLSMVIQDNLGIEGDPEPLLMFARAEQHIFMNDFEKAKNTLDSIQQRFPDHQIMDDVLYARANIHRNLGAHDALDSLLALITDDHPDGLLADQALFERADLQEHYYENRDKAMALYQQLMQEHPASVYTVTARNRFRKLRGDMVN